MKFDLRSALKCAQETNTDDHKMRCTYTDFNQNRNKWKRTTKPGTFEIHMQRNHSISFQTIFANLLQNWSGDAISGEIANSHSTHRKFKQIHYRHLHWNFTNFSRNFLIERNRKYKTCWHSKDEYKQWIRDTTFCFDEITFYSFVRSIDWSLGDLIDICFFISFDFHWVCIAYVAQHFDHFEHVDMNQHVVTGT